MEDDKANQYLQHLFNKNVSGERKVEVYNDFGKSYDQNLKDRDYSAPRKCAEVVGKYFPDNRENIIVFDIGAGTGLVAEEMQNIGFRIFDGLDASQGMINEAEKKHIYRNLYCDYFTAQPLPYLLKDSYDLLTVVGSSHVGHIPSDAIIEMLRLTKSDGIICIVNRRSTFYDFPEVADKFFPLCDKLEQEGKWKKEEVTNFTGFLSGADGIIIVYRVK